MDRFTEAFRTELSGFVKVVQGGPVLGATVADAVEVAWIAEAATESLRRGVPVRIEEVDRHDEDRRRPDLLGRLRGTRLGLPTGFRPGARPRCARPG